MVEADAPPLPGYDLGKVIKLRDALVTKDLIGFYGFRPEGPVFDDLVATVTARLGCPEAAVRASVADLAGVRLTEKLVFDAAWRLAGNYTTLKKGKPAPPWTGPGPDPVWAAVEVVESLPEHFREDTVAAMQVRVVAGPPCPLVTRVIWSRGVCKYAAQRIGFTAPWGPRPFKDFRELTRMRLYLLVDAARSTRERVSFSQVRCPAAMLKANRELLDMRNRTGFECPNGYQHRCYQCPVGYVECPAGTRRFTFEAAFGSATLGESTDG